MAKKIFLSYSHAQQEWVKENGRWRLRVPLMLRWLRQRG